MVRSIAGETKPFTLEIGDVEFSTTYFQSIFARVKTNAQLFNVHMSIKKAFGVKDKHVFMPHISLVYGDFDMEKRSQEQ